MPIFTFWLLVCDAKSAAAAAFAPCIADKFAPWPWALANCPAAWAATSAAAFIFPWPRVSSTNVGLGSSRSALASNGISFLIPAKSPTAPKVFTLSCNHHSGLRSVLFLYTPDPG